MLLKQLSEFLDLISRECHEFTITGRLHGINLESDRIELDPNVLLMRLDDNAINKRQPFISSPCETATILDYSNSNVEVVIRETYTITPRSELSYFKVANKASDELHRKLDEVVRAIKLYRNGRYEIYPATVYNPLYDGGQTFPNEPKYICPFENVSLSEVDVDSLKRAFAIVKKVIPQDSVLARSFSRFLIGSDERVPEEQIVDFVIAWESLLLTVKGGSIQSELTYRFSLNGAALLSTVDDTLGFDTAMLLMKHSYAIRSKVVHGESSGTLLKDITALDFDNLEALNRRLSGLYQKVVYWLATLKRENRPYYRLHGWESLIRN